MLSLNHSRNNNHHHHNQNDDNEEEDKKEDEDEDGRNMEKKAKEEIMKKNKKYWEQVSRIRLIFDDVEMVASFGFYRLDPPNHGWQHLRSIKDFFKKNSNDLPSRIQG